MKTELTSDTEFFPVEYGVPTHGPITLSAGTEVDVHKMILTSTILWIAKYVKDGIQYEARKETKKCH